jgi:HlyD family secretion protein
MDKVMAGLRDRFAGLRDLPPEARAAASDALRAEMRRGIARTLDAEQKKRFDLINAEIDARRSQGGAASASVASPAGAAAAKSAPATLAPGASEPASGAAPGTGQAGGPLAAFRARLERELDFTEAQKSQLDGIFSGMRSKFGTVREAEPAERPRLMERYRAEMRAAINDILDDRQKKKYAEILVELAGRNVSRGRVFMAGPDDKPIAIELRLGLSDGAFTEVISVIGERKLSEGDRVFTGVVTANNTPGAAPPKSPARPMGPRL